MDSNEVFQVCRDAMYVLLMASAPAMATALLVGLVISFIQAITQIQESTLTFVPKILAVFVVLALSASFMLHQLTDLTVRLHEKIAQIE